jgi:hypothetical protein
MTDSTAARVLREMEKYGLKETGQGQYRSNSPFRQGSDSGAFALRIRDGEHGGWHDHVSGESGSLYDLAQRLAIPLPEQETTKRAYVGLADYAAAHHVTADVFKAAGWKEVEKNGRPALSFPTRTGVRWRFLDDQEPRYLSPKGYQRCWYGLERALEIAADTGQSLVICNGEASTIVAQHYGIAACCITGGEQPRIPKELVDGLWDAYQGGFILVAFDSDTAGRQKAPQLAAQLTREGFAAREVDLGGGVEGYDLADFAGTYNGQGPAMLEKLPSPSMASAPAGDAPRKKKPPRSKDYIRALEGLGYTFRLNETNDVVEVKGEPINDPLRALIRSQMRDKGFHRVTVMEDAYTAHAYTNRYHPIRDYLQSLQWDGRDHIARLAGHFHDTHPPVQTSEGPRSLFHIWLKRWLCGAVAKAMAGDPNMMLVLDGPQRLGKSYFARWLGGVLPEYFIEEPIVPDDKDSLVRLISKWIWEVAELGSTTRRADREALKHFITTEIVTVRKAFGRHDTVKPALASLVGTINNEAGFLNDPTGNRRFLVVTLREIEWDYSANMDPHQVWAQVFHLYRQGETGQLTREERALQAQINAGYEIDDPLEDWLRYHFHIEPGGKDFMPTARIISQLQDRGMRATTRSLQMQLASTAKRIGLEPDRKGGDRGYKGISIKGNLNL